MPPVAAAAGALGSIGSAMGGLSGIANAAGAIGTIGSMAGKPLFGGTSSVSASPDAASMPYYNNMMNAGNAYSGKMSGLADMFKYNPSKVGQYNGPMSSQFTGFNNYFMSGNQNSGNVGQTADYAQNLMDKTLKGDLLDPASNPWLGSVSGKMTSDAMSNLNTNNSMMADQYRKMGLTYNPKLLGANQTAMNNLNQNLGQLYYTNYNNERGNQNNMFNTYNQNYQNDVNRAYDDYWKMNNFNAANDQWGATFNRNNYVAGASAPWEVASAGLKDLPMSYPMTYQTPGSLDTLASNPGLMGMMQNGLSSIGNLFSSGGGGVSLSNPYISPFAGMSRPSYGLDSIGIGGY